MTQDWKIGDLIWALGWKSKPHGRLPGVIVSFTKKRIGVELWDEHGRQFGRRRFMVASMMERRDPLDTPRPQLHGKTP